MKPEFCQNTYVSFKNPFTVRRWLIIAFVICLISCESLFHEEEISIGKIESYEELEVAVNGVYGLLIHSFFNENYYAPLLQSNLKGDDLSKIRGGIYKTFYLSECDGNEFEFSVNNLDAITILWGNLYQTIASINNILNQFDASSTEEERIREILGEMYFIRAYCYFRLTRTFGQVPIVDDIDIDYNLEKPSFVEIYSFIEKDLKTAAGLLPLSNNLARQPYITPAKGSAKAVLAEIYLSWAGYPCGDASKYLQAAETARGIIDSAAFYGLDLLDDFANIWDQQHFYNSESVFSLYTTDAAEADYYEARSNIYSGWYEEFLEEFFINPEVGIRVNFYSSEKKFFNRYPNGYRKDITFYNNIYNGNPNAAIDTGYYHFNTVSECTRVAYRKFYLDPVCRDIIMEWEYPEPIEIEYNFFIGTTRAYILRYASTLLTYAEASARAGRLNELSYECVNRIRRRAHQKDLYSPSEFDLQPGLTPEAFTDSVVWERAWELAGEPEGRWFDLVRLGKVEELYTLGDGEERWPNISYDKDYYFFPIPASDTILNPNLGNN